jgi:hypothetical protein
VRLLLLAGGKDNRIVRRAQNTSIQFPLCSIDVSRSIYIKLPHHCDSNEIQKVFLLINQLTQFRSSVCRTRRLIEVDEKQSGERAAFPE